MTSDRMKRGFDEAVRPILIDGCRTRPEFPGNMARAKMDDVVLAWLLGYADDFRSDEARFRRGRAADPHRRLPYPAGISWQHGQGEDGRRGPGLAAGVRG